MTQQQFEKAVQISERMKDLESVKKEINPTHEHRLCYSYKTSDSYKVCPEWSMRPISDILDKHDEMIRQEIEDELERLRREVERL